MQSPSFGLQSDEAFQGRVRSALVKGNVPSIIHAPPAGKSYHSIQRYFRTEVLDRFGTRETWGQGASAAAMSSNDGARRI
jgi:hypothetical protein